MFTTVALSCVMQCLQLSRYLVCCNVYNCRVILCHAMFTTVALSCVMQCLQLSRYLVSCIFLFSSAKRICVLYLVLCYVMVYDLFVVRYYRSEFTCVTSLFVLC